jgi:PKD repeat protein
MRNPSSALYQPLRVSVESDADNEQQEDSETKADYVQVSKDATADPTVRTWLRRIELRRTTLIGWDLHV